jgi:hypothetical protein
MEEIKISDLSIGDWVQDKNGKYAQILGIENWSDGYLLNVRINGVDIGCVPSLAVYPIRLTPEILEKNGWAEYSDVHNSWKLDIADNMRVWLFKNSHDWTFQVMNWGLGHNHCLAKAYITSIHQLQHALRLAGVKKEIEV